MKWFKHFTDAHDNGDLTKVRMKYGADGYAIYWYCLELIAGDLGERDLVTFELKHDAEVVGFNLNIDTLKVEEIMKYMVNLGLFEQSGTTITCLKLAKYLDKKSTRNETIHKIIDAATVSATVADITGQLRTLTDCPRPSPLDTDTDTDTDTEKEKDPPLPPNGGKRPERKRFSPPSVEDVRVYCRERKNFVDPQKWHDHYSAKGWKIGSSKMVDWKAAVRTWEEEAKAKAKPQGNDPLVPEWKG